MCVFPPICIPLTHRSFSVTSIPVESRDRVLQFLGDAEEDGDESAWSRLSRVKKMVEVDKASVFTSSNTLDEHLHQTGKLDRNTHAIARDLRRLFEQAKALVDKNPEYLLILSSDHGATVGGGAAETELHGQSTRSNTGLLRSFWPKSPFLTHIFICQVSLCSTTRRFSSEMIQTPIR
jgi:hypothetical protein